MEYTYLAKTGFELTTLGVIGTDCTGSCKSTWSQPRLPQRCSEVCIYQTDEDTRNSLIIKEKIDINIDINPTTIRSPPPRPLFTIRNAFVDGTSGYVQEVLFTFDLTSLQSSLWTQLHCTCSLMNIYKWNQLWIWFPWSFIKYNIIWSNHMLAGSVKDCGFKPRSF